MSNEPAKQSIDEQLIHDFIIYEVKEKYGKIHKEVYINPGQEKNFDVRGIFPDIAFGGYGHITHIVEVETTGSLNRDRAAHWEKLAGLGVPCTILVAKRDQRSVTDILWKTGLMAKVNVATYDVVFEKL